VEKALQQESSGSEDDEEDEDAASKRRAHHKSRRRRRAAAMKMRMHLANCLYNATGRSSSPLNYRLEEDEDETGEMTLRAPNLMPFDAALPHVKQEALAAFLTRISDEP